jgi:hypothetical protein
MTARARFTQADITRAVRALKAENFQPAVILSPDGTVRIEPVGPSIAPPAERVAQLDPVVM